MSQKTRRRDKKGEQNTTPMSRQAAATANQGARDRRLKEKPKYCLGQGQRPLPRRRRPLPRHVRSAREQAPHSRAALENEARSARQDKGTGGARCPGRQRPLPLPRNRFRNSIFLKRWRKIIKCGRPTTFLHIKGICNCLLEKLNKFDQKIWRFPELERGEEGRRRGGGRNL